MKNQVGADEDQEAGQEQLCGTLCYDKTSNIAL